MIQTSPLELMRRQVETLFRHDSRGRLTTVNEPGGGRAPRLFLGRTREGHVLRLRDDLPDDLAREIETILRAEPPLVQPGWPPLTYGALRAALARDQQTTAAYRGPAYLLDPAVDVDFEGVRLIGPDEADRLHVNFPSLANEIEDRWPCAAAFDAGNAVSVCFSSRLTAHTAEAGVETRESHRGRGLAPRVVARWAAAIRQSGRIAFYSTAWENAASQRVAAKLGATFFGEDLSLS